MDAAKIVRRKISLFAILSKREVDKIYNVVSDEVSKKKTGMHAFDTAGAQRTPLETQDSTCCFPAKTTGLASLCVQLTVVVISVLITIFFFYQIGGLDEIGITNNSTTLLNEDETSSTLNNSADTTIRLLKSLESDQENDTEYHHYDFHAPFRNTTLVAPGIFESDAYELIRLSTYIYLILAIVWFCSLVLLLFSIKFETLELVLGNGFVALVSCLYLLVHAIFLILLVIYKFPPPLALRPSLIIYGSAGIQILCSLLTFFGMYLLFGWYKFIVYVNSGERCLCISAISACCIRKKRNPPQEYAMPEVTAAREIPIDRDFSNF